MKLARIVKNRKAMTPLMIGLIVAASVVVVLFVVMAAVVPSMKHEVHMQIEYRSIQVNSSANNIALKFNIMCDYTEGEVWRAEIYYQDGLYAHASLTNQDTLNENDKALIVVSAFTAEAGINQTEVQDGQLVFQFGHEYILRVYYRPVDSDIEDMFTELEFTFVPPV